MSDTCCDYLEYNLKGISVYLHKAELKNQAYNRLRSSIRMYFQVLIELRQDLARTNELLVEVLEGQPCYQDQADCRECWMTMAEKLNESVKPLIQGFDALIPKIESAARLVPLGRLFYRLILKREISRTVVLFEDLYAFLQSYRGAGEKLITKEELLNSL